MKRSLFIHILSVNRNSHNLCQKHIVSSQRNHLAYPALQIHRTLCNSRRLHMLGLLRRQMQLLKFIHIPSRTNTAGIHCRRQIAAHKINHKRTCLLNDIIRIPFFSNRYGNHGRIRAYRSCPGHGNNIGTLSRSLAAYHNCRNRIQHIAPSPMLFFQQKLSFPAALIIYSSHAIIIAGISCFFLETTPGSSTVPLAESLASSVFSSRWKALVSIGRAPVPS